MMQTNDRRATMSGFDWAQNREQIEALVRAVQHEIEAIERCIERVDREENSREVVLELIGERHLLQCIYDDIEAWRDGYTASVGLTSGC
jgi:hypothetical protein